MSTTHVSAHYTWAEFEPHDGTGIPLEAQPHIRRLCDTVLEPLRARWGGPIVIVSGYRSLAWNTRVGGAQASRHMVGDAADFRPVDLPRIGGLKSLVELMLIEHELPEVGGCGVYHSWIHLDCRPRHDGHIARWSGDRIGSERT